MTEKLATAEIERLAAAAPSAPDLARKQLDQQRADVARNIDQINRRFAVEQATKACKTGGYDVADIVKLAREFHGFLTAG